MTEAITRLKALEKQYKEAGDILRADTIKRAVEMLRRTHRQMEAPC